MSAFNPHIDAVAEAALTFATTAREFLETPAMRRIRAGVNVDQYKSVLREIYHYTKENPQMQASATAAFRGDDRFIVKQFLRHALSEVGHEQLALDDLRALGADATDIPDSQPLPSTIAFTAYGFHQIRERNPVGYLGYLYFLESLPTHHGEVFQKALTVAGVPVGAMSFLADHMAVDMGHNRLMDEYLRQCVHTQQDLDAVIYAMRVCAYLYSQMLGGALDRATSPAEFGTSWEEHARRKHP